MKSPLLHTKQLSIGYTYKKTNKVILSGIDLQLFPGQLIGLLGPNGVGKSTLLRTLAGVQPALSGKVMIGGQDITGMNALEVAQKISLVLTDRSFSGNLNVLDLVSLGRYPHTGWSGSLQERDHRKIKQAIEQTQVEYLLQQKLHQISDGQLQKAMIARALAQDGEIMILDEPTAHLDLNNKIEILLLLKKLGNITGKGIIIATHELDLAVKIADQIWLAQCNEPVHSGMPEELAMSGVFQNIYSGRDYHIDHTNGQVKLKLESRKKIKIAGENEARYWTGNALQRNGYQVTEGDADLRLEIAGRNNNMEWKLFQNQNTQIFTSLSALIDHLQKK